MIPKKGLLPPSVKTALSRAFVRHPGASGVTWSRCPGRVGCTGDRLRRPARPFGCVLGAPAVDRKRAQAGAPAPWPVDRHLAPWESQAAGEKWLLSGDLGLPRGPKRLRIASQG
jgi:hypothetical protein